MAMHSRAISKEKTSSFFVTVVAVLFVAKALLLSPIPSHQEKVLPACTLKVPPETTRDNPCILNVYIGDSFVIDCTATGTHKNPTDLSSTAAMAMCPDPIGQDQTTPCATPTNLFTKFVASNTKDTTIAAEAYVAVAKDARNFASATSFYAACWDTSKNTLYVKVNFHPYKFYPTYISATCVSDDAEAPGNCEAQAFKNEKIAMTFTDARTVSVPADLTGASAKVCTGTPSPINGNACKAESAWTDIYTSGKPAFDPTPTNFAGVIFTNSGTLAAPKTPAAFITFKATTTNKFTFNFTLYGVEKPSPPPAMATNIKWCDTGKCLVSLNQGDTIVLNCSGQTGANPSSLLSAGKLCKVPLSGACTGANEVAPTDLGLVATLDTLHEQYVVLKYQTAGSDNKKFYAGCPTGSNSMNAEVTLVSTTTTRTPSSDDSSSDDGSSDNKDTQSTTSSAYFATQVSFTILAAVLAIAFVNSVA